MTGDLLRVNDLAIEFAVHDSVVGAVDGVSFRVRPGSTVAVVGESGSGKSVISQAIMGILPRVGRIARGEILFADPRQNGKIADISRLDPDGAAMRAIRGGSISIVFQEPMTSLSPLHTVGDQISEALHLHRQVDKAEGRAIVEDMLKRVGFPNPRKAMSTYPFELSGGLRQRAMIAMALVCRPALLIADEPTTALDVTIQAQILKLLRDLQADLGMAILLITHDLGVVANMAEEIVVMYRGKVMEAGMRDDIFRRPQHPYLKALLRAVPRFDMAPGERLVPLREIKSETGHLLAAKDPWPAGADAAGPLLSVQHLRKSFSIRKSGWFGAGQGESVLAVDDVSFDIRRGECLGLVGESGCGKTTLSKMLLRALSADAGTVTFNDHGRRRDVFALNEDELVAFRRKIQFIFQDPYSSLNPRMTVFDIISEPLVIHRIGDAATRAETVRELMQLVGLDARVLNRYPHNVSIQAQILNLLQDLKEKLGLTYLFISHNLAVVDYVAERIAVMCAGRLVELAPRRVLFHRPIHPYTRALVTAVPEPSIDRRLDLSALMEGRASIPAAWPWPFTIDATTEPDLVDLGDGHFVRADRKAGRDEILRLAGAPA
ncbi:MAG: ABC transporter ATP-binding protein [Rhodospirillales bacterium]|nr:ABC transporter ATP-binding protein [Rhodospirillales bacterium]